MNGMKIVVIAAVAVIPIGVVVRLAADNHRAGQERIRAEERARREQEEAIASALKDASLARAAQVLVKECRRLGDQGPVALRGKALIWDTTGDPFDNGKRSPANDRLSGDIQTGSRDTNVTVFLVVEKHNEQTASYGDVIGLNGRDALGREAIHGYRVDLDVAVVHLPDKAAVGLYRVQGAEPPQSIRRTQFDRSPEYGDTIAPLAAWVQATRRDVPREDNERKGPMP